MSTKKILTVATLGVAALAISGVAIADDHGGKHKHGGKMIEKMFEKGDLNGDGVISKAEFLTKAEERFAKMDLDGNGEVTKDEAKAHHEEMRKKWKEMKEKKKSEKDGSSEE